MLTRNALRALALCLMASLSGCGLSLLRPEKSPPRVDVVVTPGALDPCIISHWIVPIPLNADQAGLLAEAARDESKECAARHDALIDDVRRHNGDKN